MNTVIGIVVPPDWPERGPGARGSSAGVASAAVDTGCRYSRSGTGPRAATATAPRRILMACASLAVPPILLYRIVRRVLPRRGRLNHVVLTFPLLTVFVGAWALGEAVGWMAGPGDALSRVM
jgi:hypothetical protein